MSVLSGAMVSFPHMIFIGSELASRVSVLCEISADMASSVAGIDPQSRVSFCCNSQAAIPASWALWGVTRATVFIRSVCNRMSPRVFRFERIFCHQISSSVIVA